MYLGVNYCGREDVVTDDSWKDYYKGSAKAIGLNHCIAYVWNGWIYFYFQGTPFGYGGDFSEDWIKRQSYGKWKSEHISQIKNTKLEYELYADDFVHISKLGNIRFTYRPPFPGHPYASTLDTVDGMKVEFNDEGRISKVGSQNI